jgi:hypothetical protein
LKPAVEALALIVRNDECVIGSAAELRTNFLARTFGGPTMEISGVE